MNSPPEKLSACADTKRLGQRRTVQRRSICDVSAQADNFSGGEFIRPKVRSFMPPTPAFAVSGFADSGFATSFAAALLGTSKVFAMGAVGYAFIHFKWLGDGGLRILGQLVGLLTLPCLIFYRFATRFDPQTLPDWWKYALGGTLVTALGLLLGKALAIRWKNDEATMTVGYQNAGFFVLPMMQTLLSPAQYEHGSLLLFLVFIPFNATLWLAGSWFLLGEKRLEARRVFTPTFCATVGTLALYGLFHDALHSFDGSFLTRVLLGTEANRSGALQQIGDMTVPLSTFALGGSVAVAVRGLTRKTGIAQTMEARPAQTRAAFEVSLMKLIGMPLCGLLLTPLLLKWLGKSGDPTVLLLFALQWAAPPATSLASFAEQHDYLMTLIPLASLMSYVLCLVTVPFWVALSG